MNKAMTFFLLIICSKTLNAADTNNWQAILAEDPISGQTGCLLVSASQQVHDGQGDTSIQLLFNGSALIAETRSNIDLSYANVGLQVDNYPPHSVDRLLGENSAIFETDVEKIRQQLIRGARARLALGFWPTWPKTQTVMTAFSLYGFTRAYDRFLVCRQKGELP